MRWEADLLHDMGLLGWEVIGNEMGRQIYHMTWDFQDGKWQVIIWEDEFT